VPWVLLVVAGLLEVGWAAVLPATHGLTRLLPTLTFLVLLSASMLLLAVAARSIPLGTAYSVWVGIGAVGAAIVGIVWHGDPATPARLLFLSLLIVSIVGLKFTGSH
jgi:quaternary ammonium compound-resistance protein SugE